MGTPIVNYFRSTCKPCAEDKIFLDGLKYKSSVSVLGGEVAETNN